jgi:pimeloyl-ACP methyl ester carboxylesterase
MAERDRGGLELALTPSHTTVHAGPHTAVFSNRPAWKTKPTWYMVAAADRSINPDQERMMAKRARAKTVEVNGSHVAYMSYPKETAKLIEEAATSVGANQ